MNDVRVLVRYDIKNLSETAYEISKGAIFSESPVDTPCEGTLPKEEGNMIFSVKYPPGQFDQRTGSVGQHVKLLEEDEGPVIRSVTTYVMHGDMTLEQVKAVKSFCINPMNSREIDSAKPETPVTVFETPADVIAFSGFQYFEEEKLLELYQSLNLTVAFKDFQYIQNYFAAEKRRGSSMTEVHVLNIYWSDHYRHTTF